MTDLNECPAGYRYVPGGRMREMSEWVSVEDRLPKNHENVLVFRSPFVGSWMDAIFHSGKSQPDLDCNSGHNSDDWTTWETGTPISDVTHWMTPDPPSKSAAADGR